MRLRTADGGEARSSTRASAGIISDANLYIYTQATLPLNIREEPFARRVRRSRALAEELEALAEERAERWLEVIAAACLGVSDIY